MPRPAEVRCQECGAPAQATRTQRDVCEALCFACLDRLEPLAAVGSLRRALRRGRRQDGTCPYCGWTEEQLVQTALVGCPLCYEALNLALL